MLFDPPPSGPSTPTGEGEDMLNILDETEQGERSKRATTQIPVSEVNLIPSSDSTHSRNVPRATNDDD